MSTLKRSLENNIVIVIAVIVVTTVIATVSAVAWFSDVARKGAREEILNNEEFWSQAKKRLVRQIESGSFSPDINDEKWKKLTVFPEDPTKAREFTATIHFDNAFQNIPRVVIGIRDLDLESLPKLDSNGRQTNISLTKAHAWVNIPPMRDSFKLTIKVWDRCALNYIEVDWLAYDPGL